MPNTLSRIALQRSIQHLIRFGDTDVFPHLPELAFLRDCSADILGELEKLDVDNYKPSSAVAALAPKSRFGFRIVHQMSLLDTILLLAAVIDIGDLIEARRTPIGELGAFSYRFRADSKGSLFPRDRTYKDWLQSQLVYVQNNLKIKRIISTDISDFYSRVNFHRLENLLDEVAPRHIAIKYIKKHIKTIRARQSFGLPVGGSAARLLAELSLADTDRALNDDGLTFTRFVDDFRIYLRANEDPYDALAMLADQLATNEGLALNAAKTQVLTRLEFIDSLKKALTDISDEANGAALEQLTADLYFDDEPDDQDLIRLKGMNLLEFLQEEVSKELLDVGRIKVIFRALKIAKPSDAIEYIANNFTELVVFSKEVTLLMDTLEAENSGCFDGITDRILDSILSPPASSLQIIRTWLLELFVRGTVPIDPPQLKKLTEQLRTPTDLRQLHLIRGRLGDKNFFRKNKANFDQLTSLEKTCFVWGASCFAQDEYSTWLNTIKKEFSMPMGELFLDWAKNNRPQLVDKISSSTNDFHE